MTAITADDGPDYLASYDAAAVLAYQIEHYWQVNGAEVQVRVEPTIFGRGRLIYVVRSALQNGLPPAVHK